MKKKSHLGLGEAFAWVDWPRVARCFGALFFLFLSYYLVKPLRNSQFLKEFPPQALPWIYLLVSGASLALTRVFQWSALRFSRKFLVASTFLWAILCKALFYWGLPQGGHAWTGGFYLWASIYFLLLVSTLWGCLNERFTSQQGERYFSLIALGSTLGNIAGAQIADWLVRWQWSYGTLLLSATALGLSLLLLWPELSYPALVPCERGRDGSSHDPGWSKDRFLRSIGIMVLSLAIYSTALDFVTQRLLDRQVGQQVYAQQVKPHLPQWSGGQSEFGALRALGSEERQFRLESIARENGMPAQKLQGLYRDYRDALELRLRGVFANIFWAQGLSGMVVLSLICRPFLRRFGVATALQVLPVYALLTLPLLVLPLETGLIQVLLIVSGTLNYSFNNPTKEVLYTVTSSQAIVQAKPFLEGPLLRLGDVICALMTLGCLGLAAFLGWPEGWSEAGVLVLCSIWIGLWWSEVRRAGGFYGRLSASGASPQSPETEFPVSIASTKEDRRC